MLSGDLQTCLFLGTVYFTQEEQEEIMRIKEMGQDKNDVDKCLTWADTKKMPMTSRVIQETMRVASILSFTFREAVEDVEFEGKQLVCVCVCFSGLVCHVKSTTLFVLYACILIPLIGRLSNTQRMESAAVV